MQKRNIIITPKLAQKIQDDIFKKMTAVQKVALVGQFFELGKKLNALNDRRLDSSPNNIRDEN